MDKPKKILWMIFVTNNQAAEILQPRKKSFDLPTTTIPTKSSSILSSRSFPLLSMRGDHFNPCCCQFFVQGITVVGFIADQPLWELVDKALNDGICDKGDFMRRSSRCVNGDRKTSAVCHCHDLRTFAPLGLSNLSPPFLATTNMPSMKHSLRSSSPRFRRSSARTSRIFRNVPSRTHRWNLQWQVWYGGYLSGMSSHPAPVRKIQMMPFNTSRESFHGLPFPSSRLGRGGIRGLMICHCSSVSSSCRAIHLA